MININNVHVEFQNSKYEEIFVLYYIKLVDIFYRNVFLQKSNIDQFIKQIINYSFEVQIVMNKLVSELT